MPLQNRQQYDRQWDIVIPAAICALLGLIGQIDLLIRVATMFWNLPNQNFNTFIAQFTFTSRNENWEALFISNYTGDKISVGVTRLSHIGQSVPCDG